MIPPLDVGVINYISNHMVVFRAYGADKIPTLTEVNTYDACLGALRDHAKLVSKLNVDVLDNMEEPNGKDT